MSLPAYAKASARQAHVRFAEYGIAYGHGFGTWMPACAGMTPCGVRGRAPSTPIAFGSDKEIME
ncbi:MAG: hypothetical protein WAZ18_04945 [Alphaproteobacteria bacterium]